MICDGCRSVSFAKVLNYRTFPQLSVSESQSCASHHSIRIVLLSRYVNTYGTMAPMSIYRIGARLVSLWEPESSKAFNNCSILTGAVLSSCFWKHLPPTSRAEQLASATIMATALFSAAKVWHYYRKQSKEREYHP